MAARPPWLPQASDGVDAFGLPHRPPSLLGDTPEAVAARHATAADAMRRLFAAAVLHLGEAEARELWNETAKPKRGRPARAMRPDKDAEMLAIYDACIRLRGPHRSLPGKLARYLASTEPGACGNSAKAVEMKLRTLVKKRVEKDRKQAELTRLLFGTAEPPPTMLTGTVGEGAGREV